MLRFGTTDIPLSIARRATGAGMQRARAGLEPVGGGAPRLERLPGSGGPVEAGVI